MAAFHLFLFLPLIITSISSSLLTGFTLESSPVAPYQGGWWFLHYDTDTRSIWMLNPLSYNGSSWKPNQYLQSYHIDSNTWTQHAYPNTTSFHTWSQSYTSIGSTLYFVTEQSTVGTFNSKTQTLIHPHPDLSLLYPNIVDPCMTSDGRYVFIIGGHDTSSQLQIAYFQIYDTANAAWLNASHLNTPRKAHTCQYHNGYIYIFGGVSTDAVSTDSIEMMYVGFNDTVFTNALSQQWTVLTSTSLAHGCVYPTSAICSVIYPELIYIFGGYENVDASNNTAWILYDFVQIFNTTSHEIYDSSVTFNKSRAGANTFCVDNYIYVMFGAGEDGTMWDHWERSNALYADATEEEASNRSRGIMMAGGMILGTVVIIIAMWMCSKMVEFRENGKNRRKDLDVVRIGSASSAQKESDDMENETERNPKRTGSAQVVRLASVERERRGTQHAYRKRSVQREEKEGNYGAQKKGKQETDAHSDTEGDSETGSSEGLYGTDEPPHAGGDIARQVTAGATNEEAVTAGE